MVAVLLLDTAMSLLAAKLEASDIEEAPMQQIPQQGFFQVLRLMIFTERERLKSTLVVCEEVKVAHIDFRLQRLMFRKLLHTCTVEFSNLFYLSLFSGVFLLTELLILSNQLVKKRVLII